MLPSDRVVLCQFKHPPHWVPLKELMAAMLRLDASTGQCRGYVLLSHPAKSSVRGAATSATYSLQRAPLLVLTFGRGRLDDATAYFQSRVPQLSAACASAELELWRALRSLPPPAASLVTIGVEDASEPAHAARSHHCL